MIAVAWAAVTVLGLLDRQPETLLAGVPMLIVSLIVFAVVPWTLRCPRCRAPIAKLAAQCRNCGQVYGPVKV
jgi:hypothetical protein